MLFLDAYTERHDYFTMKTLFLSFCVLLPLAVVLSIISHIASSYVLRTCVRYLDHIIMTAMLLALLFFPIVVSCTDLLKPATRSLVQTIIDLIHLCETLTTLLLLLEMDILFAKNDTRHLFERILLLTFINVVSRMVPSGQLLSVKMLPESSQAQLQSTSDARCEEMVPVPLPPVSINLELSSYLQIQDSEASDDEVSDDESCMANDEYMSDGEASVHYVRFNNNLIRSSCNSG